MLETHLDRTTSILHVRPAGPLQGGDFDDLARLVDPFIEATGSLCGLILEVERFPGWENLGAAVRHFRFVRDHHKRIRKVAIVTDSLIGEAAEHIAAHFLAAEIRHFPAGQRDAAATWIGTVTPD